MSSKKIVTLYRNGTNKDPLVSPENLSPQWFIEFLLENRFTRRLGDSIKNIPN